jgi:hypothetical protein
MNIPLQFCGPFSRHFQHFGADVCANDLAIASIMIKILSRSDSDF